MTPERITRVLRAAQWPALLALGLFAAVHNGYAFRNYVFEDAYITFHTGNPIVAGSGLVTKGIRHHGPEERRTTTAEVVAAHAPDLVILEWWQHGFLPGYQALNKRDPTRTLFAHERVLAARPDLEPIPLDESPRPRPRR